MYMQKADNKQRKKVSLLILTISLSEIKGKIVSLLILTISLSEIKGKKYVCWYWQYHLVRSKGKSQFVDTDNITWWDQRKNSQFVDTDNMFWLLITSITSLLMRLNAFALFKFSCISVRCQNSITWKCLCLLVYLMTAINIITMKWKTKITHCRNNSKNTTLSKQF